VEEVRDRLKDLKADLVVFDGDLTPQQRNLESAFQLRVIDRSQLILDIFAQRAQSNEGNCRSSWRSSDTCARASRASGRISRLGGGIGTRGPGGGPARNVDRRRVRERIAKLKDRLVTVERPARSSGASGSGSTPPWRSWATPTPANRP
jgi:GTP-binding protein HflX